VIFFDELKKAVEQPIDTEYQKEFYDTIIKEKVKVFKREK